MNTSDESLNLDRIVFIGRTFEEYMLMFDLSTEDLIGRKILDCPAGACSFTALANKEGANVIGADIAYYHPIEQLEEKGIHDIEHAMLRMESSKGNYLWDYFGSVSGLQKARTHALTDCLEDMKQQPEHYVSAVLPLLPFKDQEFDVTLSAHFLFMYADRLEYNFHLETLKELMRVTKEEIRIFPMVDLDSNKYEHLDKLLEHIHNNGWETEEVSVPYEFQREANTILKIRRTKIKD